MNTPNRTHVEESVLYALVVAYAVLLLATMPSGDARTVPILVVPVLLGLTIYQIANRASTTFHERVHQRFIHLGQVLKGRPDEDGESFAADARTDNEDDDDALENLTTIGWIVVGVGVVYAVGVIVGGFVFMLSYIYVNEKDVKQALGVSLLVTGLLWVFSSTLGIRVWAGLIDVLGYVVG
jgi:hypothetical protein